MVKTCSKPVHDIRFTKPLAFFGDGYIFIQITKQHLNISEHISGRPRNKHTSTVYNNHIVYKLYKDGQVANFLIKPKHFKTGLKYVLNLN